MDMDIIRGFNRPKRPIIRLDSFFGYSGLDSIIRISDTNTVWRISDMKFYEGSRYVHI
jgi:hypothetical protein